MHYVYLLYLSNQTIYTGRTDDLKRRVPEHERGQVESTKNLRPLKLIHYEAYMEKQDAIDREGYLKTGDGRREIRKQLKHVLDILGYNHEYKGR